MTALSDRLVPTNKEKLNILQEQMGYQFSDLSLLQQALIHSSFAFEQGELGNDNETLEFLGDAVLDLTIGYTLFNLFKTMKEGELTKLRSALVNERNLAAMAERINLGEYLSLGKGEDSSNGRRKASILACTYEALIGAIFVDSGYDRVMAFVEEQFTPLLSGGEEILLLGDAKSLLQEKFQADFSEAPTYVTEKEEGPAHDRMFTVAVLFRGTVFGSGVAKSKKEAEQKAAAEALRELRRNK